MEAEPGAERDWASGSNGKKEKHIYMHTYSQYVFCFSRVYVYIN